MCASRLRWLSVCSLRLHHSALVSFLPTLRKGHLRHHHHVIIVLVEIDDRSGVMDSIYVKALNPLPKILLLHNRSICLVAGSKDKWHIFFELEKRGLARSRSVAGQVLQGLLSFWRNVGLA